MRSSTDWRPTRRGWYYGLAALGWLGMAALGMGWALAQQAKPEAKAAAKKSAEPAPMAPEVSGDYANRVVAYIYGNIPITREDLGEFLIARYGAEKLELLVNRRVIEHACKEKGVEVNAAEVEAALEEDCKGLNVTRQQFLDNVLKHYRKTLYEWKEDVIRPRLMLTKLCRDRVKVDDEEVRREFDARYGEKVDVRILTFSGGASKERIVLQVYHQIRNNEEEFDRACRSQENSALAAADGHVKPIGRHAANPEVERVAFSLKTGEVGPVVRTEEGYLIMKCLGRIPPDGSKKYDTERTALLKEVFDKKVQKTIPVVFKELNEKAQPKRFMQEAVKEEDLVRDVKQQLKEGENEVIPAGHTEPHK